MQVFGLGSSFNPTMVRLLPILAHWVTSGLLAFQSHNGAIAASSTGSNLTGTLTFQSHNGAIAARDR